MVHRKPAKYLYLASSITLLTLLTVTALNQKLVQADNSHQQGGVTLTASSATVPNQALESSSEAEASRALSSQPELIRTSQLNSVTTSVAVQNQTSAAVTRTSGAPESTVSQRTSGAPSSDSQEQASAASPIQPQVLAQVAVAPKASASDGTPYINIGDRNYPRVNAVDISAFQGEMTYDNFQTLKNLGVQTVIVKLTEGTFWQNSYAWQQIKFAQQIGLNVQVYHFAHFGSRAVAGAEANYLINMMSGLGLSKGTKIYADMEDADVKYNGVVSDLSYFWSVLSNNGYTNHAVYTYLPYDQTYNISSTVGKQNTWIAQYPYSPSATFLAHQDYGAWQFNAHGRIPGYNGDLDVSIDYSGLFSGGYWEWSNGSWYYNNNGSWVTGDQYINGQWYYFDANEAMHTGWLNHNNRWYYYNPASGGSQGQLMYGDQYINGNWYYFDGSGAAISGWHQSNGKYYYYNPISGSNYGKLMYGRQLINGKYYLLANWSGAMLTGLQRSADGNHLNYYREGLNNGDEVQNGTVTINGQLVRINNYLVTISGSGPAVLKTGSDVYVLGNRSAGTLASDGIYNVNGATYSVHGYQTQTGWQKANGAWYYFDPTSRQALKNQWFKSNAGYWYYFNGQGQALTGLQTVGGRIYDFDTTSASARTGWQKINGHWYYFDPAGTWALTSQWYQDDGGHWYYFNKQGQALTGLQTINGQVYDFDSTNAWARTGWQFLNQRWYYFDPVGTMAKTGWQNLNNHWYYFNSQGQALTGRQQLSYNGTTAWYWFDPVNAWMYTGL